MPDRRPDPAPHDTTARRAAEPLAWWPVLLAGYLALAPAITLTEITVGAAAAAAGAAAAVAARRALLTTGTAHGPPDRSAPVPPARLLPPLALLPAQIIADTARIAVRGASGGGWTPVGVAPGWARRGTATLLVSASPGAYVGGVDPERGLLRVHRLTPHPSPFERRLHDTGLVHRTGPETGEDAGAAPGAPHDGEPA
ncbi:hypothetical protein [Spirillospora sp. NPDC048819]|uniref:hypothetical protein n=1 Tax=Spirillospora sp. NPDC048819 TaxID=3155268 RepID=UPI0033EA5892